MRVVWAVRHPVVQIDNQRIFGDPGADRASSRDSDLISQPSTEHYRLHAIHKHPVLQLQLDGPRQGD